MKRRDLVSINAATALRELGYVEDCLYWRWNVLWKRPLGSLKPNYESLHLTPFGSNHNALDSRTSAPHIYDVKAWMKKTYGLYSSVFVDDDKTYGYLISQFLSEGRLDKPVSRGFASEEDCDEALINDLLKYAFELKDKSEKEPSK